VNFVFPPPTPQPPPPPQTPPPPISYPLLNRFPPSLHPSKLSFLPLEFHEFSTTTFCVIFSPLPLVIPRFSTPFSPPPPFTSRSCSKVFHSQWLPLMVLSSGINPLLFIDCPSSFFPPNLFLPPRSKNIETSDSLQGYPFYRLHLEHEVPFFTSGIFINSLCLGFPPVSVKWFFFFPERSGLSMSVLQSRRCL